MAETGPENLTTEQILSSIRNILLNEDKKTQPKKEDKHEDILMLTSAMVVKRTSSKPIHPSKTTLKTGQSIAVDAGFNSEDVARNIIKTFASNFAKINIESKCSNKSVAGNEDFMLRSSISKAVEDWVLKNIKSDIELNKTVREEVAKQVNVWFDANFVSLVNSSIKQELERVMAKVD